MSMSGPILVRTHILNETLLHTYLELASLHVYDKCMRHVLNRCLCVRRSSYAHKSSMKLCCTHIRNSLYFMSMTNAWAVSYLDIYEWVIPRTDTCPQRNFVAHIFGARCISCVWQMHESCLIWMTMNESYLVCTQFQNETLLHTYSALASFCAWVMSRTDVHDWVMSRMHTYTYILKEILYYTYSELASFHVYDKCVSHIAYGCLWMSHILRAHNFRTKLCYSHIFNSLHFMSMANAWVMSHMDVHEWVMSCMHIHSQRNLEPHIFGTRFISCLWQMHESCRICISVNESYLVCTHINIFSQKLCCTHISNSLHFISMTNAWVMSHMDVHEWVISRMHSYSEKNFVPHIFRTRFISRIFQFPCVIRIF